MLNVTSRESYLTRTYKVLCTGKGVIDTRAKLVVPFIACKTEFKKFVEIYLLLKLEKSYEKSCYASKTQSRKLQDDVPAESSAKLFIEM